MTIEDLKIEPEFRDLIPKLTDAEFAQLEKNILEDGRVKEPIVVWNGIIVDGHHRYYILQKHPEIPYEIEEREFANEYAAMAWACSNQLGRRNLSDKDRLYLIGKQYQEEKLAHGGDRKAETSRIQSEFLKKDGESHGRTYNRIAKEHHVGSSTVQRGEQYAKGVDIAEEVVPGMKDKILHGEINVSKSLIREISKATPDKQRRAIIAISEGESEKAKQIISPYSETIESLIDKGEKEYTEEDLIQELTENFQMYMRNLETTIKSHKEVISNAEIIIDKFTDLLCEEINKLEEKKNERI